MPRLSSLVALLIIPAITIACRGDLAPVFPEQTKPFLGCANVQEIDIGGSGSSGASISGSLSTSDCRLKNAYVDYYEISVTGSRTLTLTLNSSQFDAVVVLYDRNGNLLELDDNSGGGTNARLVRNVGPGKYIIAATSFWDNETGAYQLSIN